MKLQRDVKVTEPFGHNHLIAACAWPVPAGAGSQRGCSRSTSANGVGARLMHPASGHRCMLQLVAR